MLQACTLNRFARIGAGLLRHVEEDRIPRLVIARLEGDGILLGRHQRAASALGLPKVREAGLSVVRRLGGGRAVRAGEGRIGVYLALPRIGTFLPAPASADKLINRYIRGLNVGLTFAGAGKGAHYFGRDFVSAESRQIAVVSQDGLPSGAAVFEAVVAVGRRLGLEPELRGYPEHGDPRADGPPHACLSDLWKSPHDFDAIAAAIAEGYQRSYGCELVDAGDGASLEEADFSPAAVEEEMGLEESGVADIPIGFAEALVREAGDRIAEARLRGDFIAPAFAIRSIEEAMVGEPFVFEVLGKLIDESFRQPGAAVLGITRMRVLPDAILAAAGRL